MPNAQMSLEFLVILVAMIGILIVFMPVFTKLIKSIDLAIDVYKASQYLNEFKTNVSTLNTLEEGSSFVAEFGFVNPVDLECKNKHFKITVGSTFKPQVLNTALDLDCNFSFKNTKKLSLLVTKKTPSDLYILKTHN